MFGAIPTTDEGHWVGAVWVPGGATDLELQDEVTARKGEDVAAASALAALATEVGTKATPDDVTEAVNALEDSLVTVDDSTIELAGSQMRVKDGGIGTNKLATAVKGSLIPVTGPLVAKLDAVAAGDYVLGPSFAAIGIGNAAAAYGIFSLDPANFDGGSGTKKLVLIANVITNATDPGSTVTYDFRIYPVTSVGGGAAAGTITGIGSQTDHVSIANAGAARSGPPVLTAGVNFPAAGPFIVRCNTNSAMAASSSANLRARLYRMVA